MIFGYPLGIILILICSVVIFLLKENFLVKEFGLKKNAVLWLVFLILGGSFFSLPLAFKQEGAYVNIGGALIPLIYAFYFFSRVDRWGRWQIILASMLAFVLSFVVFSGIFIPLSVYLSGGDWLMPYLSAFVVLLIAKRPVAVFASLIFGLIGADFAKAIFTKSYIAMEIGNRTSLNNLILAVLFAYLLYRFTVVWKNKQIHREIPLTNPPQS